jgi:hypothetical protein
MSPQREQSAEIGVGRNENPILPGSMFQNRPVVGRLKASIADMLCIVAAAP